jgi:Flp pilus assembly protein TadG
MRVMGWRRVDFGDERGMSSVVFVVSLLFILGIVALVLDGGVLLLRRRGMVNAADAAALAFAQSCAHGDGQAAASGQADALAADNVSNATRASLAVNGECDGSGSVTVVYQSTTRQNFAPAVGLPGSRNVVSGATASWGPAGGATGVAPLMLSARRLSNCDIPPDPSNPPTGPCYFWWDNGTGNDTTVLTNAEWGIMDLRSWGPPYLAPSASCSGYQANQSLVGQWIANGFPTTLTLPSSGVAYVCRSGGFQGNALNNDINNDLVGDQFTLFPVNDPSRQVDRNGNLCPPGANCTVDKYAIIGFGVLHVLGAWSGQQALANCTPPPVPFPYQNAGSLRCLEAEWVGFQATSGPPGGGQDFGVRSFELTG